MAHELIIIIGGTNQGKSYFTKESIKDERINVFVFDVQNCYGSTSTKEGDLILDLPIATDKKRCRFYGSSLEFLYWANLRRYTTIVVEEATIFFEGKTNTQTRKMIVDKHHYKNSIIFMFHSISAVPPRIMQMADTVVLFKTGDEEKEVSRKYARCLPHFLKLRGMPERSKIIFKNI